MSWRRHHGPGPAEKFHTGAERGGSFATLCNGYWPLSDEALGLVDYDPSPPQAERCNCCQRRKIDEIRIEQGLDELEVNTRFDLGGES